MPGQLLIPAIGCAFVFALAAYASSVKAPHHPHAVDSKYCNVSGCRQTYGHTWSHQVHDSKCPTQTHGWKLPFQSSLDLSLAPYCWQSIVEANLPRKVVILSLLHTFALFGNLSLALVQFPSFRHRSLRLERCRKNLPIGDLDESRTQPFR